jgi:hypothetical protein
MTIKLVNPITSIENAPRKAALCSMKSGDVWFTGRHGTLTRRGRRWVLRDALTNREVVETKSGAMQAELAHYLYTGMLRPAAVLEAR